MNLNHWYRHPEREYLKKQVQNALVQLLGHYHHEKVCIIGDLASQFEFDLEPSDTLAVAGKGAQGIDVVCNPEQLPFSSKAYDLVVLLHAIEQSSNPQQLVREVNRVTRHDGHILILAFNSWSPFFDNRFRLLSCRRIDDLESNVPLYRLHDWMELLGYVEREKRYCSNHRWFVDKVRSLNGGDEKAIQSSKLLIALEVFCSVYQKQVIPLTFDASMWQNRRTLATPVIAENRQIHEPE